MAANIQRKRVEAPLSRHLPVVTPAALALLVAMLLAAGCGQTSTRIQYPAYTGDTHSDTCLVEHRTRLSPAVDRRQAAPG